MQTIEDNPLAKPRAVFIPPKRSWLARRTLRDWLFLAMIPGSAIVCGIPLITQHYIEQNQIRVAGEKQRQKDLETFAPLVANMQRLGMFGPIDADGTNFKIVVTERLVRLPPETQNAALGAPWGYLYAKSGGEIPPLQVYRGGKLIGTYSPETGLAFSH
ncbi:MAG TPA: hypothetical protein VGN57_08485 [Pirellulaceae bacterium]|nr:hypothetical protein [Pirellulaceae bacterium]